MGSIGSCCILNSSTRSALSNQKTQTEISVDIPNSIVPYTHSSKSKIVFKANEITDLSGKDSTHSMIGTVHYMAPETVSGKNYSFPIDIWSVGVILYEIFYGQIPFGFGMKDPQDIYKDIRERKPVLPYDPKNNNVNLFIGNLLDKNPIKRMNDFCKWRSDNLFIGIDFEALIKMEMKSPFAAEEEIVKVPIGNEKETDLTNTICPFHQFMKNNVYDYLNDF